MATQKRVVGVSVKRSKKSRAMVADRCSQCGGPLAFGCAQRTNGVCTTCSRPAKATAGIAVVTIDERLLTCLRERVEIVRRVYADVWDSEWGDATSRDGDAICVVYGDLVEYLGAIEYVRGAADVFDMTALTLIAHLGL